MRGALFAAVLLIPLSGECAADWLADDNSVFRIDSRLGHVEGAGSEWPHAAGVIDVVDKSGLPGEWANGDAVNSAANQGESSVERGCLRVAPVSLRGCFAEDRAAGLVILLNAVVPVFPDQPHVGLVRFKESMSFVGRPCPQHGAGRRAASQMGGR